MSERRRAALVVAVFLVALVGGVGWGNAASAGPPSSSPSQADEHKPACGPAQPGHARCHAIRVGKGDGVVTASPSKRPRTTTTTTTAPTGCTAVHRGFTPCDLQAAYNLPSATGGTGQTVAIVDAYDAPTAENDVNVYRSEFGLPLCTTANGCFAKVNQNGVQGGYPAVNTGWAQEISLDLDMVSAACPNCHIVLVEANSASFADLGVAEDTAALAAQTISNSYGASESQMIFAPSQSHYNHPGHVITVSSGDSGYGVEFPASSNYVTAVGGTSLSRATSGRGWSETAWSGAGSGCSKFFAKNTWQTDPGCAKRAVADVSAVADPNTGVAVYDSTADSAGNVGWMQFGGTSVSAPIIASVYALAGNATTVNYGSYPYANRGSLFDVTSGSNGTCTVSYLCNAGTGYDGPTGLGTPNSAGGF